MRVVITAGAPRMPRAKIKKLEDLVFRASKSLRAGDIQVSFISDRRMRTLNRRFLSHDYNTDVITFDLSEGSGTIDGEIYISYERARIQAREFGVSFENEILRLVVHGLLHLLGHNDKTPKQRKQMLQLGDHYLARLSA